jgi:hypothetical protein
MMLLMPTIQAGQKMLYGFVIDPSSLSRFDHVRTLALVLSHQSILFLIHLLYDGKPLVVARYQILARRRPAGTDRCCLRPLGNITHVTKADGSEDRSPADDGARVSALRKEESPQQ